MSDTREQSPGGGDDTAGGVTRSATGIESMDISQRTDVPKLRKNAIGLFGVLFLTVTGAARTTTARLLRAASSPVVSTRPRCTRPSDSSARHETSSTVDR
jgi:hypothetical protein